MSRRLLVLLIALAILPGCMTTGDKGFLAQKPKEPATLPPSEAAELCMAVADQMTATGHFAEAIYQLNQARALHPKADVSARLARLHAKTGQDDLALVEFDKALKASPKDAALWNDLGYFHYERGNWALAEQQYRKALELAPDNQKVWMNLGLALGQQSKYNDSLAAFEKAVRPAEARCNLAFVLGTQGKTEEARRLYLEALQIEPNLKLARVALSKLEQKSASRTTTVPGHLALAAPTTAAATSPLAAPTATPQVRQTLPPAPPVPSPTPLMTARPNPPTPRFFEYPEP